MDDSRLALFVMLGQTAERLLAEHPEIAPTQQLLLGPAYDLGALLPDVVRKAEAAAEGYRLFFVFEAYVRDLVVEVLSKDNLADWWARVPKDVQDEVAKLEETEEAKRWMALGSRDKSALLTYPQLLKVIEHNWKPQFEELLRDRSLIQEARLIAHLRNTLCHMTPISEEEMERIRQVLRDWFRMVAP
jgi:hypothetical protein